MAFSGWSAEAVEFFEGLEADNSRTYWMAHKDVYDNTVYAPMAALVADLTGELGAGDIARPYRDVRFRKDKTPYKTNIYARMERGGYIAFSAAGLTVGRGFYMMSPEQLERYRRAVADDTSGAELAAVVDRLTTAGIEVTGSATLKTAPRGYPKDHPRIGLLRHKGLFAWRQWPAGRWLGRPAAKGRVVEFLRTAAPLQTWLDKWVGPDAPDAPAGSDAVAPAEPDALDLAATTAMDTAAEGAVPAEPSSATSRRRRPSEPDGPSTAGTGGGGQG